MEQRKANTSAVRIFRKHILGKGLTEHSGRGFYIMYTDLTLDEIRDNANRFYNRHPDKVDFLLEDDGQGRMVLRLKTGYGEPYEAADDGPPVWVYRTLTVVHSIYGGAAASVQL